MKGPYSLSTTLSNSLLSQMQARSFWPSIEEMAEWYKKVLGWKAVCDAFDEEGKCTYGGFWAGKTYLFNVSGDPNMLEKAYENSKMYLFIKVSDLDQVYQQVVQSTGKPDSPLKNESWGGRTFGIKDLNALPLVFFQLNEEEIAEITSNDLLLLEVTCS